jgi:superoxide dismutase
MPLPREELLGFLSREQLALHHAEYVRLVERLHATEEALRHEPTSANAYAELRRTQVETANGVLLHELYFRGLSATKTEVPRHIQSNMSEHMGPGESWLEDSSAARSRRRRGPFSSTIRTTTAGTTP